MSGREEWQKLSIPQRFALCAAGRRRLVRRATVHFVSWIVHDRESDPTNATVQSLFRRDLIEYDKTASGETCAVPTSKGETIIERLGGADQ